MAQDGTARWRDPRTVDVPESVREWVSDAMRRVGVGAAATELGVSKSVVLRVVAGEPVMPGTLALLEQLMAKGAA